MRTPVRLFVALTGLLVVAGAGAYGSGAPGTRCALGDSGRRADNGSQGRAGGQRTPCARACRARPAVKTGDTVALLTNPELFAAVGEARAEVDKAASARDRVYAGVRDEQVQSLHRENP